MTVSARDKKKLTQSLGEEAAGRNAGYKEPGNNVRQAVLATVMRHLEKLGEIPDLTKRVRRSLLRRMKLGKAGQPFLPKFHDFE